MYGLEKADQLVGLGLNDLLSRDVPQNLELLRAFVSSGYNLQGIESEEIDVSGNTKYFFNSLVGVVQDGLAYRAWGTQLDITKQHNTTAALLESQEKLSLALKVSRLGMWEWNVATGQLTWSDEIRKIYKVPPKVPVTYELYLSRIYPGDRLRMREVIQGSMQTGKAYEAEHRIVWPNGEVHWVYSRGQAILENGQTVRMTGTAMNIDVRKSAEKLKVKNAVLSNEREELMRLNKSKDEFIALASHQLRTPATSVKQYLGMLLEGFAGELNLTEAQRRLLQTAYNSNERQIQIVNDLLLIATVDAGKIELHSQTADIRSFLQQIVDEYTPKYTAREQTIDYQPGQMPLQVSFDTTRLRMAIENLIDNASKYSAAGATTTVAAHKTARYVQVAVTDQGVGIDEKDFEKLFQKFSRIPNDLSVSSGGSGLGLYWASKIIELHGGSLQVASVPGAGSTFTISLPYRSKQSIV
jgi:signal transduction histidine kinase